MPWRCCSRSPTAAVLPPPRAALDLVPSALTYRVRQIEDALDVLLFDRRSRQARLTPAGAELLREGSRLLDEIDAIANRVKRVATGWEAQFTIAVDSIMSQPVMMELCQAFLALAPPTRLRLRDETLQGTLQALSFGQADLAIGVIEPTDPGRHPGAAARRSRASCSPSRRTIRWPACPNR